MVSYKKKSELLKQNQVFIKIQLYFIFYFIIIDGRIKLYMLPNKFGQLICVQFLHFGSPAFYNPPPMCIGTNSKTCINHCFSFHKISLAMQNVIKIITVTVYIN